MPCSGPWKRAFSKPWILMNFALHLHSTACSPDADEGYARTTYCSTRRAQKAPRSEQFSAGGKQTRPRKGGFCGAAIVIFALRASLAHCFRSDRNGGCAFEREMGGVKATEIRLNVIVIMSRHRSPLIFCWAEKEIKTRAHHPPPPHLVCVDYVVRDTKIKV